MLPQEIPNHKNLKLTIRNYEPNDSDDLINLENEASQLPFTLFGLLNVGKIFGANFDAKANKYKDHIILVVQHQMDTGNVKISKICAGVTIGIKDIYFNNRKVKAGYLFDLRVSEKYQRLGIGQALSKCLEDMAKSRGVEMLFLGVGQRNAKAVGLYEKMGFVNISARKVWSEGIKATEFHPPTQSKTVMVDGKKVDLEFKKVDPKGAVNYLKSFYSGQDLALQDFNELIESENYEGTYIVQAENGAQAVGISLTKVGNENVMGIKRFILPSEYFLRDKFASLFMAMALACILPLVFMIRSALVRSAINPEYLADIVAILAFLIISWGVLAFYLLFFRLLKHFAGHETRGRLIAPFTVGDSKNFKIMFEFLREELHNVCRVKNIRFLTFNIDSNDKIAGYWKPEVLKAWSRTVFMAKALTSSIDLTQNKRTEHMYFDPRDF